MLIDRLLFSIDSLNLNRHIMPGNLDVDDMLAHLF